MVNLFEDRGKDIVYIYIYITLKLEIKRIQVVVEMLIYSWFSQI